MAAISAASTATTVETSGPNLVALGAMTPGLSAAHVVMVTSDPGRPGGQTPKLTA